MRAYLHFGTGDAPRQTINVEAKREPLWWHLCGLMYTATGYGSKIPTEIMVQWEGRWRRVYAACFSNAASYYVGKPGAWLCTVSLED